MAYEEPQRYGTPKGYKDPQRTGMPPYIGAARTPYDQAPGYLEAATYLEATLYDDGLPVYPVPMQEREHKPREYAVPQIALSEMYTVPLYHNPLIPAYAPGRSLDDVVGQDHS